MATRGYNRYRGPRSKLKIAVSIGLILVISAAIAFLVIQNYIVYDDSGKAHLELPTRKTETSTNTPAIPDDDVQIEYLEPEDTLLPVQELHATQLIPGALKWSPEAVLSGADEAMIIPVKLQNGSITYTSQAEIPPEVSIEQENTMANLQTLLASDHYTIARMSSLCDSYFVRAYHDASLLQDNGDFWYDYEGYAWLNPTDPRVLNYLSGLCQEYSQLGFDEIMLDRFCYPTNGNLNVMVVDADLDRVQVLQDFAKSLRSALPEETALSIVLRSDLSPESGLSVEMLTECFDRIYLTPDMDAAALLDLLPEDYDSAVRVVQMVYTPPESGSYAVVVG